MRSAWREIVYSFFMGFVVPGLLLSFAVMLLDSPEEAMPPPVTEAPESQRNSQMEMYFLDADGTVRQMDVEDYLVGVVLAEMPASFETEALKAQAVVARTYTLKAGITGGKHGSGYLCGESSCCQAYITEESYLQRGGTVESIEKVRSAVDATSGYVLTYEGSLIEATYFSCSGGRTEDAVAVWGTDYPYLRSVESPGEEAAPPYTDTVRFSFSEFQHALGTDLQGDPGEWFGMTTHTSGGGVADMEIGGVRYKGTALRTQLGLRSTVFSITVEEDAIQITTKGYGHRVGMSQYGADAMAASGKSFREILAWYYPGTALTVYAGE